jgi:phosphoglycerate dehydrogenase-like enzyme
VKVLFTYHYGEDKMSEIKALGYEVVYISEKKVENGPQVDDAEILCCYNPFDRIDITRMPALKWIQLSSIGIDQVPKTDVVDRGVILTNNRGGYSIPMGEWVVGKWLEIYKESRRFYEQQREKTWRLSTEVRELHGKRVGFLGTGTIASESAKRLAGFEVERIGFNTSGHGAEHFDACYPLDQLEAHLPLLDTIVVALPSTPATRHFLDERRLGLMRDDAVLINIARGEIIDEAALIETLQKGKFLGVALDVVTEEPLAEDSPLWDFDRVLITPHNSWISEMRNERRFALIKENLRRFMADEPLMNVVDIERGY